MVVLVLFVAVGAVVAECCLQCVGVCCSLFAVHCWCCMLVLSVGVAVCCSSLPFVVVCSCRLLSLCVVRCSLLLVVVCCLLCADV